MIYFPNGTALAVASVLGASKSMSAISNAAEAVATLEASHGIIVDDIMVMTSGWGNLDGSIQKAKTVATNDVTLKNLDTTSTSRYPAGSGAGSIKEVTAWTAITQVMNLRTGGGDQQFAQYQFLESDTQRQIPTVRSPMTLEFELGDDQNLGWYDTLRAISDSRVATPLRATLPNGGVIYYNGIITMSETPSMNVNQPMALSVSVALSAKPTRF